MQMVRAQRVSVGHFVVHSHPVSVPVSALDVSIGLMRVRAATYSLYQKINSSHRYLSGPHFRQYRALLQAHAEEILAASCALDERIRQLGNHPRSSEFGINMFSSNDEDVEYVTPEDLLVQLRADNQALAGSLRPAQEVCQRSGDLVTESLVDVWIDEARRRAAVLTAVTWSD